MDSVNKFLDEYVGDNFTFKRMGGNQLFYYKYVVVSNKGKVVMFFHVSRKDENKIALYRGTDLCGTVGSFFGVSDDDAMGLIRSWFGDKLGIKKVVDLMKFVPDDK